MLLLISTNELDAETDAVCQSLFYLGTPFVRFNVDEILTDDITIGPQNFIYRDQSYAYTDFSKVWVRRSLSTYRGFFQDDSFDQYSNVSLNQFNFRETTHLLKYFFNRFKPEQMVNQAPGYFADKIDQLTLAEEVGLPIPNSYFSNNRRQIQAMGQDLIHKPASNLSYLKRNGKVHAAYTERVNAEEIPETFAPSFFQSQLEAQYEVRVLFLNGELYNCGRFKPANQLNEVDIKQQSALRSGPTQLPNAFCDQVRAFMGRIGFKIGTLDVLVTADGPVFLEMNPYGKFLFYSNVCNFRFEQKIANYLSHG